MKPGCVYRICSRCKNVVNVSCLERGGKKYTCPACAGEPWYMTKDPLCKGLWFERERREREAWRKRREEEHHGEQDETPEKRAAEKTGEAL